VLTSRRRAGAKAENAGDDQRANSTKSAAPSCGDLSALANNTDILIGHAANEGFLYAD